MRGCQHKLVYSLFTIILPIISIETYYTIYYAVGRMNVNRPWHYFYIQIIDIYNNTWDKSVWAVTSVKMDLWVSRPTKSSAFCVFLPHLTSSPPHPPHFVKTLISPALWLKVTFTWNKLLSRPRKVILRQSGGFNCQKCSLGPNHGNASSTVYGLYILLYLCKISRIELCWTSFC